MWDFEKFGEKQFEKVKLWFNMDSQPEIFTPKFIKFVHWWLVKLTPFILTIAGFLTSVYVFNYINTKYGFEKLVIILAIMFIFLLNGIDSKLRKLTDP